APLRAGGAALTPPPAPPRRLPPPAQTARRLKTRRGWVQGYNCQAAVVRVQRGRRLVLAAEATQDANDTQQAVPMMTTAVANAQRAGLGTPELFALDAGYSSQHNLTAPRPHPLIAPA